MDRNAVSQENDARCGVSGTGCPESGWFAFLSSEFISGF